MQALRTSLAAPRRRSYPPLAEILPPTPSPATASSLCILTGSADGKLQDASFDLESSTSEIRRGHDEATCACPRPWPAMPHWAPTLAPEDEDDRRFFCSLAPKHMDPLSQVQIREFQTKYPCLDLELDV